MSHYLGTLPAPFTPHRRKIDPRATWRFRTKQEHANLTSINPEASTMTPIPYLFFKGTCEEQLRTYARVFGSPEPELMRERDAPPGGSMGGAPDHIMHGSVKIG